MGPQWETAPISLDAHDWGHGGHFGLILDASGLHSLPFGTLWHPFGVTGGFLEEVCFSIGFWKPTTLKKIYFFVDRCVDAFRRPKWIQSGRQVRRIDPQACCGHFLASGIGPAAKTRQNIVQTADQPPPGGRYLYLKAVELVVEHSLSGSFAELRHC